MTVRRALQILILLNIGAIVYWVLRPAPLTHAVEADGVGALPGVTAALQIQSSATGSQPSTTSSATNAPFHWGDLESKDYREFIARLRTIGCPEQTIRDLIIADIDKLYAARIQGLRPRRPSLNYWESEEAELANNFDQREWTRKEREIEREKGRVVKELLGVDLAAERQRNKGEVDQFERRLAFLPEDKRAELRDLMDTWSEKEQALRDKAWDTGEPLSEEDRIRLRLLREDRDHALSRALDPEQKEHFELSMSPTAEALRHDLYGMGASEGDFRSLYELRRNFEEAWPRDEINTGDEATLKSWGQALMTLEEQVKGVLGEERFAMYQRGQDYRFHELNATISRFGLPRERAAEAYEYLRLSQMERNRILQTSSFTPDQQVEISSRIDAETDRALRELMGAGPFHFYKQRVR